MPLMLLAATAPSRSMLSLATPQARVATATTNMVLTKMVRLTPARRRGRRAAMATVRLALSASTWLP
jgi:hypothetical protein